MSYSLSLVARKEISPLRRLMTPFAALLVALLIGGVIVAMLGKSPLAAFRVLVLEPLTDPWSVQQVLIKATPLTLIAVGLIFCFRASRWNIGAEGQMLIGGVFAGGVAIATHGMSGWWILPLMMLAGALGGLLYAAVPAVLRTRFGISEILTSLMLVYVAELFLDYLVRGPWRDPNGRNMPQSVAFSDDALLHPMIAGMQLHYGLVLAIAVVLVAFVIFRRSLFGFAVAASGDSPRAANFAGFNEKRLTVLIFLISGALAGLAGTIELAGQVQQLRPGLGAGLGFTAIIVAFLGRLTPVGAGLSAIVIAVLLIGAESAQISLKLPFDLTRFFMGLLLLCVLVGESLERYRIVLRRNSP